MPSPPLAGDLPTAHRPTASSAPATSRWRRLDLSTRILVAEIALVGAFSATLTAPGSPLFLPYAWHKTLHVAGAILFLGTIIVTALWSSVLARSRDVSIVQCAASVANRADVAFTAPGAGLVLVHGRVLTQALGARREPVGAAGARALRCDGHLVGRGAHADAGRDDRPRWRGGARGSRRAPRSGARSRDGRSSAPSQRSFLS